MKKILFLILFIFSFGLIINNINFINAETNEISEYLNNYVNKGLVAVYDGIYNTKTGHDSSSTKWYNLVGTNYLNLTTNSNNKFTDNAFHLKSTKQNFSDLEKNTVNGMEFTLEFIMSDFNSLGKDFNTLINSNNDNFALFRRISSDELEFKFGGVSSESRPKVADASFFFNKCLISITYKVNGSVKIYINGILKAEKACKNYMVADSLFFGHSDTSRNYEVDFKTFRFYNRELTNDEIVANANADNLYGDSEFTKKYNTVTLGDNNIIGGINSVRRINTKTELEDVMKSSILPQALIYKLDKNLNLVFDDSSVLSLKDALAYTKDQIIPIFEIDTNEIGNNLIKYLKSENYYDCFVLSKSSSVIKNFKDSLPNIVGIIDYNSYCLNKELNNNDIDYLINDVHTNYGSIALIPVESCSHELVQSLYDSMVSVWADVYNYSTELIYQGIVSGATGIINDNTDKIHEIANKFNINTMTRLPLNIAHRGLPVEAPENTIEGALAAYNAGASALELDIYVTTDNQVVVIHDSTTGRTCNQDLTVESCTLAQLKQLYVNKGFEDNNTYCNCKIPTLDEYLNAVKDLDVKLFIEIKSYNSNIVNLTKDIIDKYNMHNRVAFITFITSQINNLNKYYPGSSVGLLTSGILDEISSQEDMLQARKAIGTYNSTLNPDKYGYGKNAMLAAISRGVLVYPYTFNTDSEYISFFMNGYSGLTGNDCGKMGEYVKQLDISYVDNDYHIGDTITFNVNAIKYNHTSANINNDISINIINNDNLVTTNGNSITLNDEGAINLLISYQVKLDDDNSYYLYSDVITLNVSNNNNEEPTKKGCSSLMVVNLLSTLLIATAIIFVRKKY